MYLACVARLLRSLPGYVCNLSYGETRLDLESECVRPTCRWGVEGFRVRRNRSFVLSAVDLPFGLERSFFGLEKKRCDSTLP